MNILLQVLLLISLGNFLLADDAKINISLGTLPTDSQHKSYGYMALGYSYKIKNIKNLRGGLELSHYRYKDENDNFLTDRVNTVFILESSFNKEFLFELGLGLSELQGDNDGVTHLKACYLFKHSIIIGLKAEQYFKEKESIYSTYIGVQF